jgi:hypothetical protein
VGDFPNPNPIRIEPDTTMVFPETSVPREVELNDSLLERLADKIVVKLKDALSPTVAAVRSDVPRRMTVREFSACVNLCEEVVRRRIRSRFIAKEHVEGRGRGSEYYVDRGALAKFNVTLEVAAERLQAARLRWAEESAPAAAKGMAHTHEQVPQPSAA